jgi:dynein regulatory complex protein 1
MSATEEFKTDIPPKEERKKGRRQRIEHRHREVDPDAENNRGAHEEEGDMKFRGQQQIATSLVHLDKKKASGIDETTIIRVDADLRESKRRVKDETEKEERMKALEEEMKLSLESNQNIKEKWQELENISIPQALHQAIEEQKAKCAAVLASKDALIAEFHLALKIKDEEYVKTLKKQAEDIEELLSRMRKEFKELSDEYDVQLESIEDAFLSERAELLRANKAEVDNLFEKRKQAELDYAEAKLKREADHYKTIEDQIVDDHEDFSKLKINLETDIQTLEQQLEEMQATYQLNTEKLEYNYRVLTERDNENSQTLLQLKRKQGKLKETLSALQSKYHNTEMRDKKKNEELTESYRSITKQYKDLQAKFRHFELSDNKRFDQLWAMHEEEVAGCISKALTADELITTQQLGWPWEKPDLSSVKYGAGGGSITSDQMDESSHGGGGHNGERGSNTRASGTMPQLKEEGDEDNDDMASHNYDQTQQLALTQQQLEQDEQRQLIGAKMQAMMELLVDEAQFLVDTKVKEALSSMSQEDGELAQAESMLKALGCENESDMTSLLEFFFPLPPPPIDEDQDAIIQENLALNQGNNGQGQIQEKPQAFKELAQIIKPDDVTRAISLFIEAKKAKRAIGAANVEAANATGSNSGGHNGGNSLSSANGGENGEGSGNLVHDARREEKEYWVRAAGIIGPGTVSVWTQLEKALQEYNVVLSERKAAIEEVESLQAKNGALKELLQTYLGARVNEELIIPPNQSVQFDGF